MKLAFTNNTPEASSVDLNGDQSLVKKMVIKGPDNTLAEIFNSYPESTENDMHGFPTHFSLGVTHDTVSFLMLMPDMSFDTRILLVGKILSQTQIRAEMYLNKNSTDANILWSGTTHEKNYVAIVAVLEDGQQVIINEINGENPPLVVIFKNERGKLMKEYYKKEDYDDILKINESYNII